MTWLQKVIYISSILVNRHRQEQIGGLSFPSLAFKFPLLFSLSFLTFSWKLKAVETYRGPPLPCSLDTPVSPLGLKFPLGHFLSSSACTCAVQRDLVVVLGFSMEFIIFDTVPSAPPQNVACTALTGQTIQVTWKPPPNDRVHGVVQGYKLLYEPTNGLANEIHGSRETKIAHALSTTLQGLTPYTNYTVQVLAYTRVGEGVSSNPVSCTTEETGK